MVKKYGYIILTDNNSRYSPWGGKIYKTNQLTTNGMDGVKKANSPVIKRQAGFTGVRVARKKLLDREVREMSETKEGWIYN